MTVPARLRINDTVALLAPSGPCKPDKLKLAVEAVKALGLRPIVMESCQSENGYLAGSDTVRAKDIMVAFTDPGVKGIFAIRGGYGAQRLLPLLDYARIAKHPKVFAGYSDITALHTVFNQDCGFVTYHSPMPATELYKADDFTMRSFLGNVMEGHAPPELSYTPVTPGAAAGILTGGNLSLLASSLGTPYEIDTHNKILFIEEIGEEPYRVDRMLVQLSQKLVDCRAILLGSFSPETTETLSQAIKELLIPLGKPIGADLPCGHCLPTATLPLGKYVQMGPMPCEAPCHEQRHILSPRA